MAEEKILTQLFTILRRVDDLEKLIRGGFNSPWVTTREAATLLRCSESKLNQLTAAGLIPYKRQDPTAPKSPRLFHRKDLTAYLVTGRNPARKPLSKEEKRMVEELL